MNSQFEITLANVEEFRGGLKLKTGDLPYDIWQVFDREKFDANPAARLVDIACLVSTKNELLDPKFMRGEKADPRQNAFHFMTAAAAGTNPRRAPLRVVAGGNARFWIIDGNATAQVLMFVGWQKVPVQIEDDPDSRSNSP